MLIASWILDEDECIQCEYCPKAIMIDLNDNLSMKLSIDLNIDLIRSMNVLFLCLS